MHDGFPTNRQSGGCGRRFCSGWSGQNTHPKKISSYERTMVKADTPTATVTKGNEQYFAPWVVESPGRKKEVPECGRRVWQFEEEGF